MADGVSGPRKVWNSVIQLATLKLLKRAGLCCAVLCGLMNSHHSSLRSLTGSPIVRQSEGPFKTTLLMNLRGLEIL